MMFSFTGRLGYAARRDILANPGAAPPERKTGYGPTQDAAAYEITLRHRELHRLERPALAALLAGRLDPAAMRRTPKADPVHAVLSAEVGAARMGDWKAGSSGVVCRSGTRRHHRRCLPGVLPVKLF